MRLNLRPGNQAWRLTRSGKINEEPAEILRRSAGFAGGASQHRPATVIVTRNEDGLDHYVTMPSSPRVESAALHLAHTVAARIEKTDDLPDLSAAPHVVYLKYLTTEGDASNTQAGVDIAGVSRMMGTAMPAGSWVAATMRAPRFRERARWASWLAYRMGTRRPTHHSTATRARVMTMWAGANTRDEAAMVLDTVSSAMPGFDLRTRPQPPLRWSLVAGFIATALVVAAAIVFTPMTAFTADYVPTKFLWLAAVVLTLLGVGAGARVLPTKDARVRWGLKRGSLPSARSRLWPPRKPKKFHADMVATDEEGSGGDYPLRDDAFMVGPHLIAAVVAPHAGALSGGSSTKGRYVSREMTSRIGPFIGTGPSDERVHLSANDLSGGVAILGRPHSGKSVLAQNMLAWNMLERTAPSGVPGFPGRHNTLVFFETKLDGAQENQRWAKQLGDQCLTIEVANPDSFAIDLFAVPGSVADRAGHFVNAMQYAFADGSIRDESFRTLRVVLTGGLAVTDDMAETIEGLETGHSPIYYAAILMGSSGDDLGQLLAARIFDAHEESLADPSRTEASDATLAWESLELMYGDGVTKSQRGQLQRAPGNKLDQLLALEHYFAPTRDQVNWYEILTGHRAVIILTGVDSAGHMMEANMEQLMSSLMLFSLRYNIERYASGWQAQHRSVTIFADELARLAGSTPDVITWLRDQGRSYGVRPVFATQYPDQLPDQVRRSLLSFTTLVAFTQSTPSIARELVDDFSGDSGEWSTEDVLNLAPFHAIVRANVAHQRQAPFMFASAHFADRRGDFAAEQGYNL